MNDQIEKVDNLFQSYNYEVADSSNEKVRIYTLAYGMYHAAEILTIDPEYKTEDLKKGFSDLGYATEIRHFTDIQVLEEYLFEGFFIKTPLGNELKNKYKAFTKKQIQNLPDGSKYSYINSTYDLLSQDKNFETIENKSYDGISDTPLVEKISDILSQTDDALFMIIEAPAGFGKTCTAYELLNVFDNATSKNLPFFTELSRNREARIFKHILLSEIDDQFPSGIKQKIVLDQIFKGRIPLIIDGFDELITKESNKEDVESMLTTIVDLLKNRAKIVITSRKTAIFNSEEFLRSIYDSANEFNLVRIEIKEPKIENWLNIDRLSIIQQNNFPLSQIANPVLLSYIRNISIENLNILLSPDNTDTLIDKYFSFLLNREIERQSLKLDYNDQWSIMAKLNTFFCEVNITAESKETIKEIIRDYNYNLLAESLSKYPPENRPTIDELSEILSNHVLLDRKTNEEIGFINDFILGYFVGDNILNNKFNTSNGGLETLVPQDFAYKSIEAFKVAPELSQFLLWDSYTKKSSSFENLFYFELDYVLRGELFKNFNELYIFDKKIENIRFDPPTSFSYSSFSGVSFSSCKFNMKVFTSTSFQNCDFYNCEIISPELSISFNDFAIYACTSNNDFLENVNKIINKGNHDVEIKSITEEDVLKKFFHVGDIRPRPRKLSNVKKMFDNITDKEFSRIIDSLKNKEFLHFQDDVGFITREAIGHLKHLKGNE
ncbi:MULTISPECIES: NACHT domain-containing NTPase [unclassified Sphingobacterium]|uniref:NACHT domain-containing protein n=1 Tax=unclassified Sphingobacterium TaxID=2609468 RepID=UPI00104E6D08|nr:MULTISPECIES: NACHT domain-containing protein [unclassified Sphingobacterium]MCS3557432.1 hypothetical protein [Sphingobacterium sp. JUb21]TCQ96319.1 NACHT domain-containing protein [Sphingobacterium sp. JUb20]